MTHPSAEGQPSTPTQARAFVGALIEAGAQVWQPGPGFAGRVMQLAEELRIVGPRIFDLQIGLAAFEGGAVELWTHDAHFARLPGLRVLDPLGP